MLDIYLPIAQMSTSFCNLAAIGFFTGTLSGLYGVGGGIVSVPLMIFVGIPTNIAITTSLLQIVGVSAVNVVRNCSTGNIKFKIGMQIGLFSIIGSIIGTIIFISLHANQYFYTVINGMYIFLLSAIALVTMVDGFIDAFIGGGDNYDFKKIKRIRHQDSEWRNKIDNFEKYIMQYGIYNHINQAVIANSVKKNKQKVWYKCGFIGGCIGIFSGMMGIGGGFMAMPAITYIFKENIRVASLTSAFIALVTTLPACIIQMHSTSLIDPFIAVISGIFAAFGVRIGNGIGKFLPQNILKIVFSMILFLIAIKFGYKLFSISDFPYAISIY